MTQIKKSVTAVLVIAALTCLTACGSTTQESTHTAAALQTASQETQAQQTILPVAKTGYTANAAGSQYSWHAGIL